MSTWQIVGLIVLALGWPAAFVAWFAGGFSGFSTGFTAGHKAGMVEACSRANDPAGAYTLF